MFGRDPKSNRALVAHAGVGEGDRVLDIGCGPGASLDHAHMAGAEVYGVDPSPGMVKRASRRLPYATVIEGSAEDLEFADGLFTHVWTISAFHHWADVDKGIEEAKRVLAPAGRLLVVERKLKDGKTGHGISRQDADSLAETLAEHGFDDSQVETLRAGRSDYLVVSGRA